MTKKSDQDNTANQLNKNNDAYWQSRGYAERPSDDDDAATTTDPAPVPPTRDTPEAKK